MSKAIAWCSAFIRRAPHTMPALKLLQDLHCMPACFYAQEVNFVRHFKT